MTYTIKEFHADVAAEAKALRLHATREELDRLDIKTLDPNSTGNCIYGTMTGDCDNARATRLIKACTKIYLKNWNDLESKTNEFSNYYWSSIEAYILLPEANNPGLIAYLRGETDDLVL